MDDDYDAILSKQIEQAYNEYLLSKYGDNYITYQFSYSGPNAFDSERYQKIYLAQLKRIDLANI